MPKTTSPLPSRYREQSRSKPVITRSDADEVVTTEQHISRPSSSGSATVDKASIGARSISHQVSVDDIDHSSENHQNGNGSQPVIICSNKKRRRPLVVLPVVTKQPASLTVTPVLNTAEPKTSQKDKVPSFSSRNNNDKTVAVEEPACKVGDSCTHATTAVSEPKGLSTSSLNFQQLYTQQEKKMTRIGDGKLEHPLASLEVCHTASHEERDEHQQNAARSSFSTPIPANAPSSEVIISSNTTSNVKQLMGCRLSTYFGHSDFNKVQARCAPTLLYTDDSVVIAAPTGSGKTDLLELAIIRLFRDRLGRGPQHNVAGEADDDATFLDRASTAHCQQQQQQHDHNRSPSSYSSVNYKAVYVSPIKALAAEKHALWSNKFRGILKVVLETGDSKADIDDLLGLDAVSEGQQQQGGDSATDDTSSILSSRATLKDVVGCDILVTTPERWDSITRQWRQGAVLGLVGSVSLLLLDEIHMLAERRGACIEALVSRMKMIAEETAAGHRRARELMLQKERTKKLEEVQHRGLLAAYSYSEKKDNERNIDVAATTGEETKVAEKQSENNENSIKEQNSTCENNHNQLHLLPPPLRFIAISGTVSNPEDIAQWLGAPIPGGLFRFSNADRPVPLHTHIAAFPMFRNGNAFAFEKFLTYKVSNIWRQFSSGRPTLVFCCSRRETTTTAERLVQDIGLNGEIWELMKRALAEQDAQQRQQIQPKVSKKTSFFAPKTPQTPDHPTVSQNASNPPMNVTQVLAGTMSALQAAVRSGEVDDPVLQRSIPCGIGFHHAALSARDRRTVERLFCSQSLRIVCTTTTLALGVNLPARLVIVKGTNAGGRDATMHKGISYGKSITNNGTQGKFRSYQGTASLGGNGSTNSTNLKLLPLTDVAQMCGRAGRLGLDKEGVAVIMTMESAVANYLPLTAANNKKNERHDVPDEDPDSSDDNLTAALSAVESQLHHHMPEHVNAEVALGALTRSVLAERWLKTTYLYTRLRKNPLHYINEDDEGGLIGFVCEHKRGSTGDFDDEDEHGPPHSAHPVDGRSYASNTSVRDQQHYHNALFLLLQKLIKLDASHSSTAATTNVCDSTTTVTQHKKTPFVLTRSNNATAGTSLDPIAISTSVSANPVSHNSSLLPEQVLLLLQNHRQTSTISNKDTARTVKEEELLLLDAVITLFASTLIRHIVRDLNREGCLHITPSSGTSFSSGKDDQGQEKTTANASIPSSASISLNTTRVGRLMSRYYLAFRTVQTLNREIAALVIREKTSFIRRYIETVIQWCVGENDPRKRVGGNDGGVVRRVIGSSGMLFLSASTSSASSVGRTQGASSFLGALQQEMQESIKKEDARVRSLLLPFVYNDNFDQYRQFHLSSFGDTTGQGPNFCDDDEETRSKRQKLVQTTVSTVDLSKLVTPAKILEVICRCSEFEQECRLRLGDKQHLNRLNQYIPFPATFVEQEQHHMDNEEEEEGPTGSNNNHTKRKQRKGREVQLTWQKVYVLAQCGILRQPSSNSTPSANISSTAASSTTNGHSENTDTHGKDETHNTGGNESLPSGSDWWANLLDKRNQKEVQQSETERGPVDDTISRKPTNDNKNKKCGKKQRKQNAEEDESYGSIGGSEGIGGGGETIIVDWSLRGDNARVWNLLPRLARAIHEYCVGLEDYNAIKASSLVMRSIDCKWWWWRHSDKNRDIRNSNNNATDSRQDGGYYHTVQMPLNLIQDDVVCQGTGVDRNSLHVTPTIEGKRDELSGTNERDYDKAEHAGGRAAGGNSLLLDLLANLQYDGSNSRSSECKPAAARRRRRLQQQQNRDLCKGTAAGSTKKRDRSGSREEAGNEILNDEPGDRELQDRPGGFVLPTAPATRTQRVAVSGGGTIRQLAGVGIATAKALEGLGLCTIGHVRDYGLGGGSGSPIAGVGGCGGDGAGARRIEAACRRNPPFGSMLMERCFRLCPPYTIDIQCNYPSNTDSTTSSSLSHFTCVSSSLLITVKAMVSRRPYFCNRSDNQKLSQMTLTVGVPTTGQLLLHRSLKVTLNDIESDKNAGDGEGQQTLPTYVFSVPFPTSAPIFSSPTGWTCSAAVEATLCFEHLVGCDVSVRRIVEPFCGTPMSSTTATNSCVSLQRTESPLKEMVTVTRTQEKKSASTENITKSVEPPVTIPETKIPPNEVSSTASAVKIQHTGATNKTAITTTSKTKKTPFLPATSDYDIQKIKQQQLVRMEQQKQKDEKNDPTANVSCSIKDDSATIGNEVATAVGSVEDATTNTQFGQLGGSEQLVPWLVKSSNNGRLGFNGVDTKNNVNAQQSDIVTSSATATVASPCRNEPGDNLVGNASGTVPSAVSSSAAASQYYYYYLAMTHAAAAGLPPPPPPSVPATAPPPSIPAGSHFHTAFVNHSHDRHNMFASAVPHAQLVPARVGPSQHHNNYQPSHSRHASSFYGGGFQTDRYPSNNDPTFHTFSNRPQYYPRAESDAHSTPYPYAYDTANSHNKEDITSYGPHQSDPHNDFTSFFDRHDVDSHNHQISQQGWDPHLDFSTRFPQRNPNPYDQSSSWYPPSPSPHPNDFNVGHRSDNTTTNTASNTATSLFDTRAVDGFDCFKDDNNTRSSHAGDSTNDNDIFLDYGQRCSPQEPAQSQQLPRGPPENLSSTKTSGVADLLATLLPPTAENLFGSAS